MNKIVLLDTGVLGKAVHPKVEMNYLITDWLKKLLKNGIKVLVPEIVDYELRRKLLHLNYTRTIKRLDNFENIFGYLPITTQMMLKAAEFWADARKRGRSTSADKALDGDMILAAQAVVAASDNRYGHDIVIATENVGHLGLFADACKWKDISIS